MLPVLRHMLEHVLKPGTDAHKLLRLQCLQKLDDMYQELYRWRDGCGSGKRVAELGRRHLLLYTELARESLAGVDWQRNGWMMWRLYPKHHAFQHCIEDQVSVCGNPTECWNYGDESFIGEAVKLAESAHASTLHRLIIQKYRI